MYKLQKSFPRHDSNLFSIIWQLTIPPRMKIFIWQVTQEKIATVDNLKKRGWMLVNRCSLCINSEETVEHIFNECSFFSQFLQKAMLHSTAFYSLSFTRNPEFIMDGTQMKSHRELMAVLCFILWRERCSRIFREVEQPFNLLVEQVFLKWRTLHPQHSS
ncbi:RNA-directed DNA polymerase (reverse transcriptase)-related family protein [Rhynchospora pubera]|uniref:RNA-directed DNA polymerase (Reverse transcriptase)-related family protein n=1 Tax=Rhynchospora pubera TaxID=906938 RepID=A0AAV8C4X1_9POAL|nr:RNA-directed DNA polymerase (reverse transcriptase)-related family protein [Rhynchospora pubera]